MQDYFDPTGRNIHIFWDDTTLTQHQNLYGNSRQPRKMIFWFNNLGADLEIKIYVNNEAHCPVCECKFKQLLQHLRHSTDCRSNIDYETFKYEYQAFTNRRKRNNHRKRQLESEGETANQVHVVEAAKKNQRRNRKLEANADELHRVEAEKQSDQRRKRIEDNPVKLHKVEAEKKRKAGY